MEISVEQIHELVHAAAGIGSGAVLAAAPRVVCPTEEIMSGCRSLLDAAGIPPQFAGTDDSAADG